jgi:hypothetical protein
MEDFDRTPFKNRDISRLTSKTTSPPGTSAAMSFKNARDARNGNTPEQRANAAAKKSMKDAKKIIKTGSGDMGKMNAAIRATDGFSSIFGLKAP